MYEILDLKHVFSTFQETVWIHLKGHWQLKISTFYMKVFDLNRQNIVVWCYENARNTF